VQTAGSAEGCWRTVFSSSWSQQFKMAICQKDKFKHLHQPSFLECWKSVKTTVLEFLLFDCDCLVQRQCPEFLEGKSAPIFFTEKYNFSDRKRCRSSCCEPVAFDFSKEGKTVFVS
jgi:hypothetical protein